MPGVNQFFFFRYPSIMIQTVVGQLLSFPMGRALAYILPNWTIFGHSLNPGPFTVKEHVLVTVKYFLRIHSLHPLITLFL